MNRKALTIILTVALVVLLIGATMWYNKLTKEYDEVPRVDGSQNSSEVVPAIDFSPYDFEGNAVKLSDKFGKPIVINFWATWCGPCKAELPVFEKMYEKYGEEVEFMMVNLTGGRETVEGVKEFLELSEHEFPVYFDIDQSAAINYGINSIPRTIFVNSDGTVYGSHLGTISEESLEKYIEKITE